MHPLLGLRAFSASPPPQTDPLKAEQILKAMSDYMASPNNLYPDRREAALILDEVETCPQENPRLEVRPAHFFGYSSVVTTRTPQ